MDRYNREGPEISQQGRAMKGSAIAEVNSILTLKNGEFPDSASVSAHPLAAVRSTPGNSSLQAGHRQAA